MVSKNYLIISSASISRSDTVENFRFMATNDFFWTTNHYQSHVQSFGKVLKVSRNFFRFGRIYFDYFARWGNLGLLEFCYELYCGRIGNVPKQKLR